MLSIVVPVYNVEKYLCQCLDSIVNQTLTDIEIIVVNDGSTDQCPRLIDEYARRDGRIKVIHKENGGLSSARNAALEIACGDWVGFVDSDDWADPNMFASLYTAAKAYDADMAVCGRRGVSGSGQVDYEKSIISEEFPLDDNSFDRYCVRYLFSEHTVSVCNKIFKRRIIDEGKLRFLPTSYVVTEDVLFLFTFLSSTVKVCSVDDCYYNAFARPGSLARSYRPGVMQRLVNLFQECDSVKARKDSGFVVGMMFLYFLQHYMANIKLLSVPGTHRKAIASELASVARAAVFRKNARRIVFDRKISAGMKEWGFRVTGRARIRLFLLLSLSGQHHLGIRVLGY